MNTSKLDSALTARILSADLAKGCDWAHPSRVQDCRPYPTRTRVVVRPVRALLAGSVLVLTSLLSASAFAGGLADAVAASLGRPVPAAHAAKHTTAKVAPKPAKAWTCGAWVELWQGSGSGRTCEWR